MPVEQELKYKLKQKDYRRLRDYLKPRMLRIERHTNYYFDTSHLELREDGIGLRIRMLDRTKAILTLKYKKKTTEVFEGYRSRFEFETQIPLKNAKDIIAGKKAIGSLNSDPIKRLKKLVIGDTVDHLELLGSLKNQRILFRFGKHHTLELDRSNMFDKTFYELEIETEHPKETDKAVRRLLKAQEIEIKPGNRSKLGQFVREWKKRLAAA